MGNVCAQQEEGPPGEKIPAGAAQCTSPLSTPKLRLKIKQVANVPYFTFQTTWFGETHVNCAVVGDEKRTKVNESSLRLSSLHSCLVVYHDCLGIKHVTYVYPSQISRLEHMH